MSSLQSNDGSRKEVQQKHMKKVPLHLIFDAIESANEVFDQYLDTIEMEVIMLPNTDTGVAEYEDGDEELMNQIGEDTEKSFHYSITFSVFANYGNIFVCNRNIVMHMYDR